jgi:chorismate dehydratase
VRSVALFAHQPVERLGGSTILLSASSRTSVALLELLCRDVWKIRPHFAEARAEAQDLEALAGLPHDGVLVIGDAALALARRGVYAHRYDLGVEWKRWTGLPFVFAVWAARRSADFAAVQHAHLALLASRAWGLEHLNALAADTAALEYLSGLDYALTERHRAGLSDFLRRAGVPQFLQVA